MNVTISVSTTKMEGSIGKSHKITLKDVATIEEVHKALDREMGQYFPKYAPLTETRSKKSKED